MVCLQAVGTGNVVVGPKGGRDAVNMWREVCVVLRLGEVLVLLDLRLHALLPLCLAEGLHLPHARAAVLLRISPARRDDLLVDGVVVWARQVDVWRGIRVVVGLDMGGDGAFELEVGLADARGGVVAGVERGRTSEEDGEDGIPGQQPG